MSTEVDTVIVYVSIGNSDDKLTQQRWHEFFVQVNSAIRQMVETDGTALFGVWTSMPTAPYQNACWAFEKSARTDVTEMLRRRLSWLAKEFGQDSIAWAEAQTEFLRPTP